MSERIVRFTRDVALVEQCADHWTVTDRPQAQSLASLANYGPLLDAKDWCYHCSQHQQTFAVTEECPGAQGITANAGDEMSLRVDQAEWLVEHRMAVYPTHTPAPDAGVQATLERTNALMEQMGLPHLDGEAMRTIGVVGKKGGGHYQKPADTRLASDLGLNPDDIAAMRQLSSGK